MRTKAVGAVTALRCSIADVMDTDRTQAEESEKEARVVALLEEANAIHFANQLYWKLKNHSPEASAEYHHREVRLEEITRAVAAAKPRPGN
jgi:hypothetical protein